MWIDLVTSAQFQQELDARIVTFKELFFVLLERKDMAFSKYSDKDNLGQMRYWRHRDKW